MPDHEASTAGLTPLHVFLSYAHEDSFAMEIMERQLMGLVRQNLITLFIDKSLRAGDVWDDRLRIELERADVVVFLLSDWLLRSDYVMDNEFDYVKKGYELAKRPRPVPLLVDDLPKHHPFSRWQVYAKRNNELLAVKHWGLEEKHPYIQVVDYIGELAVTHCQRHVPLATVPFDSEVVAPVVASRGSSVTTMDPIVSQTKWRWENRPAGRLAPRADLVRRINARLEAEPGTAVVLTGHGGMGKSTAAYLYADASLNKYDYIAKIAAESPEIIAEEWRSMAEWLGLPASDVQSADYELRNWLAEVDRWLLVLDNAHGVEALDWLPELPMGDILVTTRERFSGSGDFRHVTVAELDEVEAEDLLLEAAGAGADSAAVREICASHSYDPLALEKALLDLRGGMAPRRYLARLKAHERSS